MKIYKTGAVLYDTKTAIRQELGTNLNGSQSDSLTYRFDNGTYNINGGVKRILFEDPTNAMDFLYNPELYDTYLYVTVRSKDINNWTFRPDSMHILGDKVDAMETSYSMTDLIVMEDTNTYSSGFSACAKIPDLDISSFSGFYFIDTSGGKVGYEVVLEGIFILMPKEDNSDTQSVIAAINSQTGTLGGKLDGIDSSVDQAADDIQQSIEDQYSGDPETEFSVDDVITQHNEKMGVLSFGSDVMLQFLDMFQSANVGTAQLTLPGFNITVENVEYSVWPDYSFNFEQLNEWVPGLMSVIRVMLPAFVWLMVLRYCINVFEKNFLSNGG